MPRIRVLIADDTTLVRRLLAHQLTTESDFEVVGEAENGREAVEMASRLRPDVVVMDLNMPLLNGAQATERILAQQPYIKIILLTAHDDLASVGRLSGATECLSKSCTPQELATAIRRVQTSRSPESAGGGMATGHQVAIERLAMRAGLSDSEKTVVERVVTTDLTIHQIAAALSNEQQKPVTDSSVKHALERAMNKLRIEPRTRAALVKHVLEFGDSFSDMREAG